ncbi:TPA: restriction endonuclease, partial [Haemophilus influenzae]
KMKGNIYVPENTNIRRGKSFFDEFLKIKYEDVDSYIRNLSESPDNIKAFDDLYRKIMAMK